MKIRNLFKTVLLITIFSVITRVAGFIFRIYLSRTIGAESLGLYQIAFSIFIVLVTLICSGLPLTVSRLTAKYDTLKEPNKRNRMITSALIVGALSSLILCLVILIFNQLLNFIFADSRCIFILLTLLPAVIFSAVYSVIRGFLWGQNNYFVVCLIELLEQLVRIIVCVFALSFMFLAVDGSIIASISLSIATLVSSIAICIYYFKKGGKLEKPQDEHKELIKTSLPITGIRVVSSMIQPIIALLIPIGLVSAGYTNGDAVALYGIAMGMAFPLLFLPTTIVDSLAIALIPDLASALACNNHNYINNRIKNSITFSFYIACLCVPVFMALGVPICQFLFDSTQAGYFLQSASIIMIPLALNGITTTILNSLNLEKKSFLNYIIGSIFLILSIIILPKYIDINAIIVGMGLSTLISTSLNLLELKRQNKLTQEIIKPIILLIVMIIPTSILTANIYGILDIYLPLVVNLIICGITSLAFYVLLCQFLNIVKIQHLFASIKISKVKKKKAKA
ncbi:MAG: oligosaccharide flippase family protein [Clostridia bacterium]|nr:oligosaccharide flippase family protein [Clostridia bacterium]